MVDQPYRILSLDGGGIRGLVTAVLLERLEQKLNRPLQDCFDMFAGTSTGSLIACGLAAGKSATEIKNLYFQRGLEIFPRFWDVVGSLVGRLTQGYSQPIYSGEGLERVLKDEQNFGTSLRFVELAKPTLVTSYDTYNRQAVVFKNTKPSHANIPVWEICRASAAAPVAFPAHVLREPGFLQELRQEGKQIPAAGGIPLIDGAVVANDPSACAIAERERWNQAPPANPKWVREQRRFELQDVVVASFGTGQPIEKKIDIREATGWGAGEWASPFNGVPLLDVVFDGSADATDYIVRQLLPDGNYFRFQPFLLLNPPYKDTPSFSANPQYLAALEATTRRYLTETGENHLTGDEKLEQLINALQLTAATQIR